MEQKEDLMVWREGMREGFWDRGLWWGGEEEWFERCGGCSRQREPSVPRPIWGAPGRPEQWAEFRSTFPFWWWGVNIWSFEQWGWWLPTKSSYNYPSLVKWVTFYGDVGVLSEASLRVLEANAHVKVISEGDSCSNLWLKHLKVIEMKKKLKRWPK